MVAAALASPLIELQPRGRELTFEEWLALGEDEGGELVDGHLEEEEMPDAVHEMAVTWLAMVLRVWLGSRGYVLGSDSKYGVAPRKGRKPDLSVFLPGRDPPPRRGRLSAPDIAVELITPTARDERRDRVEKRLEYAAFGVRWYWLVDPALGTFEILELTDNGEYRFAVTATAGVIENVPGCEGLRIDVDALWADLARLGPEET